MTVWTLAACTALAILPTTNRDRAVRARMVRGPAHSIENVMVNPTAVEAARKALAGRERIAV
ncbi:MAG: hypothetical protein LC745_06450, partial [Planctomycetia bacterium]|nr:hypothetical protein [Planctomycetia bacterium]